MDLLAMGRNYGLQYISFGGRRRHPVFTLTLTLSHQGRGDCLEGLFDGDGLGEVAGLIDVAAAAEGYVVGE